MASLKLMIRYEVQGIGISICLQRTRMRCPCVSAHTNGGDLYAQEYMRYATRSTGTSRGAGRRRGPNVPGGQHRRTVPNRSKIVGKQCSSLCIVIAD